MSARFVGPLVATVLGVVGGVYTFKPALVEERSRRVTKIHERATPPGELPITEIHEPPAVHNSRLESKSSSR